MSHVVAVRLGRPNRHEETALATPGFPSAPHTAVDPTAGTAFGSAVDAVRAVEPRVADAIGAEIEDQRASLKLIASENYASPAVLLAMGNWFSDKYAEGTVGRRFYAGCRNVDTVEENLSIGGLLEARKHA